MFGFIKSKKSEPKKINMSDIYRHCTSKNTGTRAKRLISHAFYGVGEATQQELIRAINAAFEEKNA